MKLIWSKSAVEKHERGVYDPAHTISNVTPSAVGALTRQFRAGCPWIVTDDEGSVLEDSRDAQDEGRYALDKHGYLEVPMRKERRRAE